MILFNFYLIFKAQMDFEGSAKIGSLSVRNFENHNFGYMYQQDLFCGVLTVKEHLYFMVNYRMICNIIITINTH